MNDRSFLSRLLGAGIVLCLLVTVFANPASRKTINGEQ